MIRGTTSVYPRLATGASAGTNIPLRSNARPRPCLLRAKGDWAQQLQKVTSAAPPACSHQPQALCAAFARPINFFHSFSNSFKHRIGRMSSAAAHISSSFSICPARRSISAALESCRAVSSAPPIIRASSCCLPFISSGFTWVKVRFSLTFFCMRKW